MTGYALKEVFYFFARLDFSLFFVCSVLHILSTLSCPYDLCAAFLLKAVYCCVLSRNNKAFFLKKELWELQDVSIRNLFSFLKHLCRV